MLADLRLALRALRARPALTLGLLLTVALGAGANAAMLGALDALLVRAPAHAPGADALRRVYLRRADGRHELGSMYPEFAAVRARAARPGGAFDAAAAYTDLELPVGVGARARPAGVRAVSGEFFALTGPRPALGRLLTHDDDRPGPAPAAVVSHAYWRRALGGDSAVLGRALRVGPITARVVGVAPPGFAGVDFRRVDVWLPLTPAAQAGYGPDALTATGWKWLRLLVRPRPGAPAARGEAELTDGYRALMRDAGGAGTPDWARAQVVLGPVQEARGPGAAGQRRLPVWLAAMSGALLLAAAANAAGLLVARALERRREAAVRLALGARRRHLARAALAEALVLAAGAAALAAAAGAALSVGVRRHVLGEGFEALPAFDGRRLALTACVALAVCVAAALGAAPAAGVAGGALRGAGRGEARPGARTLGVLVAAQAALTFVLLAGAALFAASLRRAVGERIGYDADRVLVVTFDESGLQADSAAGLAAQRERYRRARTALLALPGVAGATPLSAPTLRAANATRVQVPGRGDAPAQPGGGPWYTVVAPDYFAVSGTRLLAGRAPVAAAGAPDVAPDVAPDWPSGSPRPGEREVVVGAHAARLLWPNESPLGRCVVLGWDDAGAAGCRTVVGVAEEARRFGLDEGAAVQLYVGGDFATRTPGALLVRTRGAASEAAPAVRRAIAALDPAAPYADVRSLAELFAPNYRPWRAGAALLGAFGAVALALAAAGLAGAVAYGAAARRREVGVRVALGAGAAHVLRLLAGGVLVAAGAGLVVGAAAAAAGARAAAGLLYGVSPADPRALGAAAATLLVTAVLTAGLAARRGLAVPPTEALRAE